MNPSVMARRAATLPARPVSGTVGTNPALRPETRKAPVGAVRNRKATKRTSTQRNGLGRMSEWAMPVTAPYGGWR